MLDKLIIGNRGSNPARPKTLHKIVRALTMLVLSGGLVLIIGAGVSFGEQEEEEFLKGIGFYDSAEATFHLKRDFSEGEADLSYQLEPDGNDVEVLVGDWTGDGLETMGFYDHEGGRVYFQEGHYPGEMDHEYRLGPRNNNWEVLIGDWTGDGIDTIGFYDHDGGKVYFKEDHAVGEADREYRLGPRNNDWEVLIGDWNDDGKETIGFYDHEEGKVYLKKDHEVGKADYEYRLGPPGNEWTVLVGDWSGDGGKTLGFYDHQEGKMYLKKDHQKGDADQLFRLGPRDNNWVPLTGKFFQVDKTHTYYDFTLEEMLLTQMSMSPQRWDGDGGFEDAEKEDVEYYLDPANFRDCERGKFMFLVLSESSGIEEEEMGKLLEDKGILDGTEEYFLEGSKKHELNEIFLVALALHETGNGESDLAQGIEVEDKEDKTDEDKVKVYNMFGIGAYDSDPEKYGAKRAYEKEWFSPQEAIMGGAKFVGGDYIHDPEYQQDTIYQMRWYKKPQLTIDTELLRVREEPTTESREITLVDEDETYDIEGAAEAKEGTEPETEGSWFRINYDNGKEDKEGWVAGEYVEVTSHQYATDVYWAYGQTARIKELYDKLSTYDLQLDIPKYED